MRARTRMKALGLVLLTLVFGAVLFQGVGRATSGSASDPDDTSGNLDIQTVTHADDGSFITFGFSTFQNFSNADDVFLVQWDLDLNNNSAFGEANDACILLEQVSGDSGVILRGSLKPACGDTGPTADATRPTLNSAEIKFTNTDIRAAGLGAGTAYNYRVIAQDFGGNTDTVPNTGVVAHTGVAAAATPTPTPIATPTPVPPPPPGSQSAQDTQNVTTQVNGVLTINAVDGTVPFGNVNTGETKSVGVGQLDYTNTLHNDFNWNVSVRSTSLSSGTNAISFQNMTFTPGSTFASSPGSTGLPTQGSAASFVGTDTPASNYSNPVTVAGATGTTQGAFQQTGSTLGLAVPLGATPGAYTGTLQYTITG